MEKLYSMSEVVAKYRVTARTLKFYEELGLLCSRRNYLNRRVYDAGALEVLEQILWMKKTGIRLKMIRTIFATNNQAEIMSIIAEQKSLISHEMGALADRRGQIETFLAQLLHGAADAGALADACVPRRVWEIPPADLRAAPSLEAEALAAQTDGVMAAEPCMRFAEEDGRGTLSLTGHSVSAFTEREYDRPLSLFVTARTSGRNLWLFFGDYRLQFRPGGEAAEIVLYDRFLRSEWRMPDRLPLRRDTYMTVQWVLRQESTVVYVDGAWVFSLDYADYDDYRLRGKIGVGTDGGDELTVKDIRFTEIGSYDMRPVDLASMRLHQSGLCLRGEELAVFSTLDRDAAGTAQEFALPLRVDLEAKTDGGNIRLSYHKGGVILGWEKDRLRLPCRDVMTGEETVLESGGFVSANEYHTVSWMLHTRFTALLVDGVCRYHLPVAWEGEVADRVRVGTAFGSTVTVRRLTVTELQKSFEK